MIGQLSYLSNENLFSFTYDCVTVASGRQVLTRWLITWVLTDSLGRRSPSHPRTRLSNSLILRKTETLMVGKHTTPVKWGSLTILLAGESEHTAGGEGGDNTAANGVT